MVPHHDIPSLLAYAATGADVNTTIVNGRILMRNRKLLTINEEEVLYEVLKRSKRLVEGI